MTAPQNRAEVAEAIAPTLDRFVLASTPMLRDCAEAVYEQLLYSVQDYLKANAEWNIGNEIDRCRKIEIENIELRALIHQLGENAAKAAVEYAEEVGRLRTALWLFREFTIRNATQGEMGANHHHPIYPMIAELIGEMGGITSGEYYRFVQPDNRAAFTEPTDG